MSGPLRQWSPSTGPWVPIYWGAIEASRSALGWRGMVALGMALLLSAPHAVVALLGPALVLGLSPPCGAALTSRRASGWACFAGGLLRAALAALLIAPVCAINPRIGQDKGAMVEWCVAFAVSAALLSGALRTFNREHPLGALLLAPLAIGASWVGVLFLWAISVEGPGIWSDAFLGGPVLLGLIAHAAVSFAEPPVTPTYAPRALAPPLSREGRALVRSELR